ncbi:MAG: hypothetical protein ACI9J3_000291 [Parvicellaceae bacterium]|jgi:uncharacterized protein (TIGR00369 family)
MDPLDIYIKMNKFDQHQGLKLTAKEPGDIQYEMEITEQHLSSPKTCHGGAISGMMDSVIGTTALSLAFTEGNLVSTVEFKINYFKPVYEGDTLVGTGTVEFKGKSLMVACGKIVKKGSGDLVAMAQGTFNIYPMEKRGFMDFA